MTPLARAWDRAKDDPEVTSVLNSVLTEVVPTGTRLTITLMEGDLIRLQAR